MPFSTIASLNPPLTLVNTQDGFLLISPVTLPSGITIAQFSSFTLTIRSDPAFPRQTAAAQQNAQQADPTGEGWPVVFTGSGTGSVVSGANQVSFLIPGTTPLIPGYQSMVAVVYGELMPNVIAGVTNIQLLQETWVSIYPG